MKSEEPVRNEFVVEVLTDPESGRLLSECWLTKTGGNIGRFGDLPSRTYYDLNLQGPIRKEWHSTSNLHRLGDKPAVIVIDSKTGVLTEEAYFFADRLHRENGKPARIERSHEGKTMKNVYAELGKLHRLDGPAIENFHPKTGEIVSAEYWEHGVPKPVLNEPDSPTVG